MTNHHGLIAGLLLSLFVHLLLLANWSLSTSDRTGHNVASVLAVELMAKVPLRQSTPIVSAPVKAQASSDRVVSASAPVVSRPVPESDVSRYEKAEPSHSESVLQAAEIAEPLPMTANEDVQPEVAVDSNEQHRNQLLKLIYLEINKHKHYPFMAKRRGKQGLVRLNFVMHPDGQVSDIAIVQSSRYALLDEAATRAVQSISPFRLAASYLDQVHRYDVDIEFRLN
jgi:TonB family protein